MTDDVRRSDPSGADGVRRLVRPRVRRARRRAERTTDARDGSRTDRGRRPDDRWPGAPDRPADWPPDDGRARRARPTSRRRTRAIARPIASGRPCSARPLRWWNRPWTNERVVRVLVTSSALVDDDGRHDDDRPPQPDLAEPRPDLRQHHADRGRHGRPRLGARRSCATTSCPTSSSRVEHGLVRRAAAVPLLHGDPGAGDRRARRRPALRRRVQARGAVRSASRSRSPAGRSAASPRSATRSPSCSPSPG